MSHISHPDVRVKRIDTEKGHSDTAEPGSAMRKRGGKPGRPLAGMPAVLEGESAEAYRDRVGPIILARYQNTVSKLLAKKKERVSDTESVGKTCRGTDPPCELTIAPYPMFSGIVALPNDIKIFGETVGNWVNVAVPWHREYSAILPRLSAQEIPEPPAEIEQATAASPPSYASARSVVREEGVMCAFGLLMHQHAQLEVEEVTRRLRDPDPRTGLSALWYLLEVFDAAQCLAGEASPDLPWFVYLTWVQRFASDASRQLDNKTARGLFELLPTLTSAPLEGPLEGPSMVEVCDAWWAKLA